MSHPSPTSPAAAQLPPLRVARSFPAPRAAVFAAWSKAEAVKRWFSPEGCSVPEARVEMRIGGAFDICMRLPDGQTHWMTGVFTELAPPDRLAFDGKVADPAGKTLFHVHTEVVFADDVVGTRMEVSQVYCLADPALAAMAAGMVDGATEGWRTTLDKLQAEIARSRGGGTNRSVAHGMFYIERSYDAPVERVWAALTDEAAKTKWFAGPPGQWELLERSMDVRPGGRERLKGRWQGGVTSLFDATYYDVVANERLVYAYEMHLDGVKISVSLATLQLTPQGGATTLKITEQGAFLDGYDDAGSREHGTGQLLAALGASLAA